VTIVFAGGLLAAAAGVEPILGSFLAGMVFSYTFRSKGRFEEKLNALGFGFLIPFFFVGIGSSMEVGLLASPENIIFSLFLTVMVFVSNIYPMALSRPLGISMKDACSMSLLLSSPLSMIVVAGTLGEKMGFLSLEMNEVLILTALTAGIVYPLLFRFITKKL
ncbi:MAG: cation:proton antiporter, partial [Desulfobulbaceae bacterium]|nr:cation:proton antiporter [Desulfobulbaceae bacterium]